MEYTIADFFCGAGGFSEGFNKENFKVVFALDNWKPAVETHHLNHPECSTLCKNILDLKTIEDIDKVVPDTDIIIGSPPCISFSNSNKSGKGDKTLGLQLIKQFLRIILHKKCKPGSKLKYFIMENVPNSLKYIKDFYTAEELDLPREYSNLIIKQKNILVASDYSSPQGRKRAICGDYILPELEKYEKLNYIDKVFSALGPPLGPQQEIKDPFYENIILKRDELTDHFYDSELPQEWVFKARKLKTDHGYMGKMEFPDRTNRHCRTIMATESYCSRESIIFAKEDSDNKYRAPTIRELASLMGFPITYQFVGNSTSIKHKQIGNAVCVHLSMALARAIKEHDNLNLLKNNATLLENLIIDKVFNLNTLKEALYCKHEIKPKKFNSKFKEHIPYLKINQYRVELDNIYSNFENKEIIFNVRLHKGTGKKATCTILNVEYDNQELNKTIDDNFKERVYSKNLLHDKYCNPNSNNNHYSPEAILNKTALLVNEYSSKYCNNKMSKIENLELPHKIYLGYYILSKVNKFLI